MKKNIFFYFLVIALLLTSVDTRAQRTPPVSNSESPYFSNSKTKASDTNAEELQPGPTSRTSPAATTSSFNDVSDIRIFPSLNMQATVNICIDKNNPDHLVASCETANNSTLSVNEGRYYSLDGGMTWSGSDVAQNNSLLCYGRPNVSYSNTSRANKSTGNGTFVGYQPSLDAGANWGSMVQCYGNIVQSPVAQASTTDNSPSSPYVNNIYTVWNLQNNSTGVSTQVLFSKSTNNGGTFGSPVILKNGPGAGSNVQTGPNGEIYVCWNDREPLDPTFPYKGAGFSRSLDGGNSFTAYRRVIDYTGIRSSSAPEAVLNNTYVEGNPTMAVDKSLKTHRGRLYMCTNVKEGGSGKAIVQVTYSDDRGDTWSTPVTVSIAAGRQNWNSKIAVDDCSGEIWVIYYTFDTGSGFTTNTYLAHSTDGGNTWENQKVSDVPHTTAPVNPLFSPTGYAGFYNGIAAYEGKAYPVWSDNRSGNWQLYCSPVTSTPCTPPVESWPKAYGSMQETIILKKGNFDNPLLGASVLSFAPNTYYNHEGVFPTASTISSCQYNSNGVTNWLSDNYFPGFAFKSGVVEMINNNCIGCPSKIYFDGNTGNAVAAPLTLVPGENVIAETNTGEFITTTINFTSGGNPLTTLYVRSPTGILISTTNIGSDVYLGKFNPITNNIMIYSYFNSVKIYHFTGTGINYVSSVTIPFSAPFTQLQNLPVIDNQDKVYYIENDILKCFDYQTGNITTVTITGFNNNNLQYIENVDYYTGDRCLVYNKADNYLYCIDIANSAVTKILCSGTGLANWHYLKSFFSNNEVYLQGEYFDQFQIGNQVIPDLPAYTLYDRVKVFVTKLSLQNDFSKSSVLVNNNIKPVLSMKLTTIPNPTSGITELKILKNGKQNLEKYSVTITNRVGRIVLRNKNAPSNFKFSTTGWEKGVYYVEAINANGGRVVTSFIKL